DTVPAHEEASITAQAPATEPEQAEPSAEPEAASAAQPSDAPEDTGAPVEETAPTRDQAPIAPHGAASKAETGLDEVLQSAGMQLIETKAALAQTEAPAPAVRLGRARKPAASVASEALQQVETH